MPNQFTPKRPVIIPIGPSGSVLIWLVAVFLLAFFHWHKFTGLGVESPVEARIAGDFQVVQVPNISRKIYSAKWERNSLIEILPLAIEMNARRDAFYNYRNVFSGFESARRNFTLNSLFQLDLPKIMSDRRHNLNEAPCDLSHSSPNIYDLKANVEFPRLSPCIAGIRLFSIPNDNPGAILQDQGLILYFRNCFHLLQLRFHVPSLSPHLLRLCVHFVTGLSQQFGLPYHRANLQKSNDYEAECEPYEFPLYSYILAALFAALIASWGGWLSGGGHRVWGSLFAVIGLGLITATMTAIGFADPMFWRVGWRILTGQDPDRRDCQDDEHSQLFQHNRKIVQQKFLTDSNLRYTVIISRVGHGERT